MKSRTNVTINKDLLESAKKHNLVLSNILERAIKEELKKKAQEEWLKENKTSIEHYNRRVEESGLFSDDLRTF